jgi:hypothetical protein
MRIVLSLVLMGGLIGAAVVAQKIEPTGTRMTQAAEAFLDSLSADQKAKAQFTFDDKERINWHFIPLQDKEKKATRKGLPLEAMNADQKKAALELVKAGTSAVGYEKATTIMSLEAILKELESKGQMVRNPDWYFFSVFGKPSKDGKWGWRVEGHHLSLNFTVDKGKVVSATPNFFGCNPATVKAGPKAGLRTLPLAEDLAIDLFKSLDDDQKKIAFKDKEFPEIEQGKAAPDVGAAQGLSAKKMNANQRATLVKLLKDYTSRMPDDVGKVELEQVEKAGVDDIHFAFAGGTEPGKPHTYRIQGPTFVVEFLNVQADSAGNAANHIHSSWRHTGGDFGITK